MYLQNSTGFQCKYINNHYILQCILVITVSSCLLLFCVIYQFTRNLFVLFFTLDAVILTVIFVSSMQHISEIIFLISSAMTIMFLFCCPVRVPSFNCISLYHYVLLCLSCMLHIPYIV